MNIELNNERVYFICLLSKLFDLPASIVEQTEKIVANEFTVYDSCEYLNIPHECVSIAATMYICQTNNIELDVQQIDSFLSTIYTKPEKYNRSKKSVDRHYKRISENYKNADILKLNESNRSIKILATGK
jgi:hypothetical protein